MGLPITDAFILFGEDLCFFFEPGPFTADITEESGLSSGLQSFFALSEITLSFFSSSDESSSSGEGRFPLSGAFTGAVLLEVSDISMFVSS